MAIDWTIIPPWRPHDVGTRNAEGIEQATASSAMSASSRARSTRRRQQAVRSGWGRRRTWWRADVAVVVADHEEPTLDQALAQLLVPRDHLGPSPSPAGVRGGRVAEGVVLDLHPLALALGIVRPPQFGSEEHCDLAPLGGTGDGSRGAGCSLERAAPAPRRGPSVCGRPGERRTVGVCRARGARTGNRGGGRAAPTSRDHMGEAR